MKAYLLTFSVDDYAQSTPARVYLEKDYDQAQRDFKMLESNLMSDKVSLDVVELYGAEEDETQKELFNPFRPLGFQETTDDTNE